ncbi:MAG TPA: HAD family hydrolase [Dehalococcoidia bacterium]|nr:HAD family hydrolase [Dehalococcoidia bacterium]
MKYKAVIFDLFGTLIDNFSAEEYFGVLREMASVLSAPEEEFTNLWLGTFDERATGLIKSLGANIDHVCQKLNLLVDDRQVELAAQIRFDFETRSVIPRPDAIKVLSCLKSAGYKTGLVTDCSSELTTMWEETPLAPLIDVPVFSCVAGIKKPDPRIYLLATEQLGVQPEECLYVGDGSSQELSGAASVGMSPVLIRVPSDESIHYYRIDAEDWDGPSVSSLSEVLKLVK